MISVGPAALSDLRALQRRPVTLSDGTTVHARLVTLAWQGPNHAAPDSDQGTWEVRFQLDGGSAKRRKFVTWSLPVNEWPLAALVLQRVAEEIDRA